MSTNVNVPQRRTPHYTKDQYEFTRNVVTMQWTTSIQNKKVLQRERKRHTDRCVSSTCYAVPVGGGTYPRRGGTYPRRGGTYSGGGGYLPWWGGTYSGGGSSYPGGGGTYPGEGVPTLGGGYLLWWGGTYPGGGYLP